MAKESSSTPQNITDRQERRNFLRSTNLRLQEIVDGLLVDTAKIGSVIDQAKVVEARMRAAGIDPDKADVDPHRENRPPL